jgi:phosphonate transport system substrate-binding protein
MKLPIVCIILIFTVFFNSYAKPAIRYGISSVLSASNTFIHYEELNGYIADKLGFNSEIIHKENYSDMNKLIESQQVDFASICTGAMLYLSEDSYTLIAAPEIDGKNTYQSLIIANKNISASKPEDLKGKTFAMTDRLSNTGFLFPTYFFSKNFSVPEHFFSKVFFTRSHDKSIYLVNKGVVDAAAVDNLVYANLKSQSDNNVNNIEIIHKSPEFGIPPIVASKKMSQNEIIKLRDILLNMHLDDKGKKILEELMIDRFTVPDINVYSNVIKMKNYVENIK